MKTRLFLILLLSISAVVVTLTAQENTPPAPEAAELSAEAAEDAANPAQTILDYLVEGGPLIMIPLALLLPT